MAEGDRGGQKRTGPTAEHRRCTFAGFPVRDGFGQVSVVALLAVVAVASGCVMATVEADPSALPSRQLVQLHVETAPPGVKVAVAGCGGNKTGGKWLNEAETNM